MLSFFCTKCGERAAVDNEIELVEYTKYSEDNICYHNWIKKKNISGNIEDIAASLTYEEVEDNLAEEVKAEIIPYSIQDQQNKAKKEYLTTLNSLNDIDKELEAVYDEIKNTVGLDVSLPDFNHVIKSMSKYDKNTQGYLSLIQSKIIDKYSSLSISKSAIGLEIVLNNLLSSMVERSRNMGEDPEGDNNFKLVTTALKFYNEGVSIMERLKEKYIIPDVDRKLDDMKETKVEKEVVEVSQKQLEKLLALTENIEEKND